MRLPLRRTGNPDDDDRELENRAGISPADHRFVTPARIRAMERRILGPTWGKKRAPYKPR